ncbi:MAG: ABC transporter ATP-binding protein/permease [Dysgonamonadaceae bacterium]|jgi:ATP-binding cassette subfamily B protein/subfamily B ATP-binding cassette protein MsbA|nr:ABC transporter ATP-binding protein/permease [Dysgonamonadaceae bacterium]
MKEFLKVLKRFVPPYKKFLIGSIVMTILSALLTLISFYSIMPILNMLFKTGQVKSYEYMNFDFHFFSINSWQEMAKALENNLYYVISETVQVQGAGYVLFLLGLFLIVTTILRTAAMYFSFYFMIPLRTGVVRDIRNQINDKVTALPLAFFSEERKGDILARISGDVNEIENSIISSLDMLYKNPILIIIYLTGMLIISWQLTLFVFIMLPIAGYIMGLIGKKLKKKSVLGQQQWGGLMAQIEETLGGLRIIKAFNAEKKISNRFHESNEVFRKTTNRIFRRQQLAHPMSELLGTITIAIVLWYGGSLILSDSSPINAAGFMFYLTIFYMLINPAKDLSKATYSIQKGLASIERVDKILKAESNIKDPAQPQPIQLHDKIEYKNVWFKYQEAWVIKDVSLTIQKGKTIALVGQSGSGKSTMVDLLPRFYDVNEGAITIDGTDVRNAKLHDVRQLMGIVNQEAILFNDTFFNNIAFGVENATLEQVTEAAKIANAHEFIIATENGYETNIGDRGCKLSGGQRQRISIARAVLKNPSILIFDEATSALDTESERLVQDALENLMKTRTTIIIAHRLSTIKHADEICVMHEGKIVERGKHDVLYELNGYYRRLCDMQTF